MLWFIVGIVVGMIPLVLMIAFCLYCGDHKGGEYIETWFTVQYNIDGCQGDDWRRCLNLEGKENRFRSYGECINGMAAYADRDKKHEHRIIRVTEQVME